MPFINSEKNKRIAKNTLVLYFRMLFQMFVALYTSKIILRVLGETDFGVYNVVGGLVLVLSFLNNTMTLSTQRFITYYLGQGNQCLLRKVFSTSVIIHFIVATIIFILGETLGLWFFNNYMNIPIDKLQQATIIFHLSLFSSIISVISIPYNASIIAHEKMSAFSVISIIETSLKLLIVLILPFFVIDKLILYGILMLAVVVIIRLIYGLYCSSHFEETNFKFVKDKLLFIEMLRFTSWSLGGNISFIAYTQGTNILLNMFFGPIVNAARGIAFQVQTAMQSFITNFQMAINPQIIKAYSLKELETMHKFIFQSSKLSYLLMLLMSLPIIIEMPYILRLWLGEYPQYTVIFCRLLIFSTIITSLSNPLHVGINATGYVKKYNIVVGGLYLSILPLAYCALKIGLEPYSVFIIQILVMFVTNFFLVKMGIKQLYLSINSFFNTVLLKVFLITIFAPILPLFLKYLLFEGLLRLTIIILSSIVYSSILIWYIGLKKEERSIIISYFIKLMPTHNRK